MRTFLKGGHETLDPRLDRVPQFDARNENFPIRALVEGQPIRSYTWWLDRRLDQGHEGACVGFSWTHELNARPRPADHDDAYARQVYHSAQRLDQWPGEDYEGTSVLAGAKALNEAGLITEYRWATSVSDLALAVGYHGPAVLGIEWHADMFHPDEKGLIHPTGGVVGGHAIVCVGYSKRTERFRLVNSWGEDWGVKDPRGRGGVCYVSSADMALLLSGGEACIPVRRA